MQNCNTVRKRALRYLAELGSLGYINEIPLEKAKELFSQILDIWDRTSLKAYFGTKAHTVKRLVQRTAIYRSTSAISNKDIYLTEHFETSPGYLEKMGLVSYTKKKSGWFMKIGTAVLVPQLVKVCGNMKNFSLFPYSSIYSVNGEAEESAECRSNPLETKQQLQDEREKTSSVKTEEDAQAVAYLEYLAKSSKETEQK